MSFLKTCFGSLWILHHAPQSYLSPFPCTPTFYPCKPFLPKQRIKIYGGCNHNVCPGIPLCRHSFACKCSLPCLDKVSGFSILDPHWDSSWTSCHCSVSWSSYSFGSVGLALSETPAGHQWGRFGLLPGPPLLCCPDEVQSLLSWALQLVRHRASSPTLRSPGPALLPACCRWWGRHGSLSQFLDSFSGVVFSRLSLVLFCFILFYFIYFIGSALLSSPPAPVSTPGSDLSRRCRIDGRTIWTWLFPLDTLPVEICPIIEGSWGPHL